jgi:Reverse transcriptase (RNA-dependent DNA polymerase)
MIFGLTNAPVIFQHLMNHMFELHNNTFLVVYLDDILIFSKTKQKHLQHIR